MDYLFRFLHYQYYKICLFLMLSIIWNRDRLYEIMDFGTYMYVLVCTEYIPVRNAENGTYMYVPVCTEFVQVL
jgi:hypothetical protein